MTQGFVRVSVSACSDESSSQKYVFPSLELGSTTSGTALIERKFFPYMPSALDVFADVSAEIESIENPDVRRFIVDLVGEAQRILSLLARTKVTSSLPSISMIINDNSTVLLEWIFNDFRIGFLVDKTPETSVWYIVTNRNLEEFSKTGNLTRDSLHSTLYALVLYALRNT